MKHPAEGPCGVLGDISEALPGSWVGAGSLSSPSNPSTAARLSSALGNALGFLGTMPEHGEARVDAVMPGEALLPTAFPRQQWGRKPY